jgi:hypothetical protein
MGEGRNVPGVHTIHAKDVVQEEERDQHPSRKGGQSLLESMQSP